MNEDEKFILAKFILEREKKVRSMEEDLKDFTYDLNKAKIQIRLIRELFNEFNKKKNKTKRKK